jgi:hypothetical protein
VTAGTEGAAGRALLATRVTVFALMGGIVMFTGLSLALGPLLREASPFLGHLLLAVLAVMSLADAAAYRVLRGAMVRRLAARAPALRATADPLPLVIDDYRKLAVVRAGLTQGPAFLGVLLHLTVGHPAGLAAALGGLALHAFNLPSADEARGLAGEASAAA